MGSTRCSSATRLVQGNDQGLDQGSAQGSYQGSTHGSAEGSTKGSVLFSAQGTTCTACKKSSLNSWIFIPFHSCKCAKERVYL